MDYYSILNVNKDASIEEIKRAYKELALKLHPDSNNGNSFLAEQFRIVNNAYSVLIDQEKRDEYDDKIGIRKRPKIYEENFIKAQYELAIKMLNTEVDRDVYNYLLAKTDSKYLSRIIIDAAKEYNSVKKEKEEENIKEEQYGSDRIINKKYEFCPNCGKKSERKYNVCEHCQSYKG